ncbi:phosphoenolpyruvate carboxykinase 2, mitochondrial [Homo sapiens]|uniref:Phosphoenolpyruvate carboxykinase 2, mitochondrial n=2 Tax=Hominidae TaxID=9604 RepID=H0YKC4_HUMAN|nr:phosphoenolpyruvate carboxykinase 2, mitochondrial [Homo sapiens]KAI4060213.1 phosphoenolpyruvate carboxykinase 2, mitochondrial [Homo sapiens]PNJ35642.1 PCK2 isoform 15 [Pongo abelii]
MAALYRPGLRYLPRTSNGLSASAPGYFERQQGPGDKAFVPESEVTHICRTARSTWAALVGGL